MNRCTKCGLKSDLSFRFCPRCGTPLYYPLDASIHVSEDFIPLLNSLYNLLAVRRGDAPHPDRRKYLPALSEKVMARRSQIEHEMDRRQFRLSTLTQPGADEALMDLYTLSLSNALAGYAYRSVEELVCGRRSEPISQAEKEYLLQSMQEEAGSDLSDSEYRVLDCSDALDRRLLFCLAVRWDNRHLKYLLADDDVQWKYWGTVLAQNVELSERGFERAYAAVGLLARAGHLSPETKEMVRGGVEQDLLHGYIVRLSESLDPL